jgi:AmmeMemoRadiSam system protein B
MTVRDPRVSGAFYPRSREACVREMDAVLRRAAETAGDASTPFGGIAPHAGWSFSGPTAARVYDALRRAGDFDTFLLFGAVHTWGVGRAAIFPEGAWLTPLGEARVDAELATAAAERAGRRAGPDAGAHTAEHSIEVQVPFVQHIFPQARILPVAVPSGEDAPAVGTACAEAARALDRRPAVIGSTDLTHYGPRFGFAPQGAGEEAHAWMKDVNDRTFLDRIVTLDARGALSAAAENHSACGAGAAAAALAAARVLGAEKGELLEHTTSHEVMPERTASDFVGYAAVIFL